MFSDQLVLADCLSGYFPISRIRRSSQQSCAGGLDLFGMPSIGLHPDVSALCIVVALLFASDVATMLAV